MSTSNEVGNASCSLAWHYTTGSHLQKITAAGWLDPKATVQPKNELPVIWFSKNQYWEPTAQKMGAFDGRLELLGMEGTCERGYGLVRFGFPEKKLIPWPKIARRARIVLTEQREMEARGVAQGATPADWMGAVKRVRVDDCVVQYFDPGLKVWRGQLTATLAPPA